MNSTHIELSCHRKDSHGARSVRTIAEVAEFELTSDDITAGQPLKLAQASGAFGVPGGEDISPQLSWSGFPAETKSFVVTVFDPDAPTAIGVLALGRGEHPRFRHRAPRRCRRGGQRCPARRNRHPPPRRWRVRFIGAGPPPGHGPHRYIVAVHALDVETLDGVTPDSSPAFLGFNVFHHAIARATLTGTFEVE